MPPLNAATRPPDEAEVMLTVMSPVNAAADALPKESVNEPDATVTDALPPTEGEAVNVAVYVVPLPEKLLSVPSVALTSASAKLVVDFVDVNVTVEVLPELTEDGFATTVMVGTTPSMTIAFAPAMLLAPLGTVVAVIALPAVSATVPMVKLETVKSEVVSPDCTV